MKLQRLTAACLSIKNNPTTKIAVWGSGKTGRSLIHFFVNRNYHVSLIDQNRPDDALIKMITKSGGSFYHQSEADACIENHDFFIPSPGIRLAPHHIHSSKHIPEFDLFTVFWDRPYIAITGSVGKTSTTSFIHQLLSTQCTSLVAGNIGTPLFDIIGNEGDMAIIEASSVQLAHTCLFAPDYALITNFYLNHLDMHANFQEYVQAKCKIFLNDQSKTKLIINTEAVEIIKTNTSIELEKKPFVQYFDISLIEKYKNIIPSFSYPINWIGIIELLTFMGYNAEDVFKKAHSHLSLPEHRLEHCGKFHKKNIDFYNDSKSTIIESTYAAFNTLTSQYPLRPITVIIGGVSKGVDRISFLKNEKINAHHIIFFGKESTDLHQSTNYETSSCCDLVDQAITIALEKTPQNGIILFSPGGASFDQFKNYEERGTYLKKIVQKINQ